MIGLREPGWHVACLANLCKQTFGSSIREVKTIPHLLQVIFWICERRMASILDEIASKMPAHHGLCYNSCYAAELYFLFDTTGK